MRIDQAKLLNKVFAQQELAHNELWCYDKDLQDRFYLFYSVY